VFEECQREHLNDTAPRRIAVLDPVKLVIDNYPDGQEETCEAPNHPQKPEWGKRPIPFSKELWIEREDFMETPTKGYFRLFPGNTVRLRYGFVIKCIGCDKDAAGNVVAVHCEYMPDSKSGTPGSDATRSRATSTGYPQLTPMPPKCASMTACFPARRRALATMISSPTSTPHR
jgi:glutaminyl-tRNA synthetase